MSRFSKGMLVACAKWMRFSVSRSGVVGPLSPMRARYASISIASGDSTGLSFHVSHPPTGKRFSARQSHWYRVRDGKLPEHWATRDDLTAMMQLGVLAPATRPPD